MNEQELIQYCKELIIEYSSIEGLTMDNISMVRSTKMYDITELLFMTDPMDDTYYEFKFDSGKNAVKFTTYAKKDSKDINLEEGTR